MSLETVRAEITKTDKEIIRLIAHRQELAERLPKSRSMQECRSMMNNGLLKY